MANWTPLDSKNKDIANEPWSLFWSESKSDSKEFNNFLMNPLSELMNDFGEIQKDWIVRTNIINHEVGFGTNLVCKIMILDPDSKTAFITLYKHQIE